MQIDLTDHPQQINNSQHIQPPLPPSSLPVNPQQFNIQQPDSLVQKTNLLAILSLVFSIVFFMIFPVGLILGIISLSQIKKTQEGGKGLAIAGIIISTVTAVINIITIIIFLLFAATFSLLPQNSNTNIQSIPNNSPSTKNYQSTPNGVSN